MKRRIFIKGAAALTTTSFLELMAGELSALPTWEDGKKHKVVLRSSWQTINIGDIGHTPGVLALFEKHLPDVEVRLWASEVGDGVKEMLEKRFPTLQIFVSSDQQAVTNAFNECDFLLHGSGPYLVAANDVERWVQQTGKPFGVYGITLPESHATENIIRLLNRARFVFFRDSVSLNFAKSKGVKAQIMEFGPDGAFGVDLRNETAAIRFLRDHRLEEGKFLCVIPKYRRTPNWKIPSKSAPFDEKINARNEVMKNHDLKPYKDAIVAVVRETSMKVLVCAEDVTQVALGKEMLYDPLPADVKKKVVWRDHFWLTDEAVSTYVRSAGLFGLEQHSPIMCIGNGIPALVGRFKEQTSKGYMWRDIGLGDWLFDSDNEADMDRLVPTVLSLATDKKVCKQKALMAKEFVEEKQFETMKVLGRTLKTGQKK